MERDFELTEVLSLPLPLLPLRNAVLFPGTVAAFLIGRERSSALIRAAETGDLIVVGVQRDAATERPGLADLHAVGVLARIRRIYQDKSGPLRVVVEGLERVHLDQVVAETPYLSVQATAYDLVPADPAELEVLVETLVGRLDEMVGELGMDALEGFGGDVEPGVFADRVAAGMGLDMERLVTLLAEVDPAARLRQILAILSEMAERMELKRKIQSEVKGTFEDKQREAFLREQMRAIQKELGDDAEVEEVEELREKLADADLSEEAWEVAERELRRLEAMNPAQSEYFVIKTYLELISELPWEARAEVVDDINLVADALEASHEGLSDVKERILEYMAVQKVTGKPQTTILCLAGPPGVGKTSIAQSVADATDRPLVRISLGGVRDEAEIRGHRRTYVGSLPGRIISALKKAKVKNPVVVLDEIDKLGKGWQGDPEDALLEVLDPEQNTTFTDHYLEIPFDLSEVLFITTANYLENISAPLRDRLEIIRLSGYTVAEKVDIAREHLVPKRLDAFGLDSDRLTITDAALEEIITSYTREAGVRELDRQITKLIRALTLKVARARDGEDVQLTIDCDNLADHLGKIRFFNEVAARTSSPGVATGLAWTPVGGDILFVETSKMAGKGKLQITGQLGDVMQESARAAMTYVRSHADELGIDPRGFENQDLHIHVPAGATPKDGPSAGVTIFTALTSLLSDRKVRSDTAMTGECTLRGLVLPVGGIKEKVLAAHRAGIRRVILPKQNERDLVDIPDEVREDLAFILAEQMSTVLDNALEREEVAEEVAA